MVLAAHSYAWKGLDWDGVCLSWVEIGWHCVCVGLAGAAEREAAYRPCNMQESCSFWLKLRARWQQTSHQGCGDQPARQHQPASQPQTAGHLPNTPGAQFGFYSYRASVCITAVTRGLCLEVSEPQGDSRTSDVVLCFLTFIYILGVLPCAVMQRHEGFLHVSGTDDT